MKSNKIGGVFSAMFLSYALVVPREAGGEPIEPAPDVLRIAVVQQNGNFGQVAANRAKALDYAAQALAAKADVILFHEELLVGYVENAHELAEAVDGPTTRAFEKLLNGSNSLVVYGLTERDGGQYYIAAVVVSKDGVLAHYRKTHLYPGKGLRDEPALYASGNKLVTFDAKGFKCGLMLCFDGDFPEVPRTYANDACSVLFWMNNRPSRGYAEVGNLAHGNSMIIATACCSGIDELGHACAGGSNIAGPSGELIAEIWNKEGMIVGDVHPSQALQLRRTNPLYICKRPELYH
jgi:N-carbamoylputrescine amidase